MTLLQHGAAGVKDISIASAADLKRISSIVLKMMRMSTIYIHSDGTIWSGVLPLLFAPIDKSSWISPKPGHILLSQNSVVDICRALAFYSASNLTELSDEIDILYPCVAGGFLYLRTAALPTDGFAWIHCCPRWNNPLPLELCILRIWRYRCGGPRHGKIAHEHTVY